MSRPTKCPICVSDAGFNVLCPECTAAWSKVLDRGGGDSLDSPLDQVVWAAKRAIRLQRPGIEVSVRRKVLREVKTEIRLEVERIVGNRKNRKL